MNNICKSYFDCFPHQGEAVAKRLMGGYKFINSIMNRFLTPPSGLSATFPCWEGVLSNFKKINLCRKEKYET
jgi:hypothetical protein